MNNFFNPFHDFNNEKENKEETEKIEMKEKKNIKITYQQKKINQLKPYNKSIAHKYLSNNNNINNPNILNIIKTADFSDEYSIKIIKYLYKNMKDNKNKQELIKILSDEI